jgi:hypothetical protein
MDGEMSLEAAIVAIVLTGVVAIFTLFPVLERDTEEHHPRVRGATARQRHAHETLYAEKNRVLREIRDLDLDYDMDKLADSTYAAQRVYLFRLAVAILNRIDELEGDIATQQHRIDEMVAALRRS